MKTIVVPVERLIEAKSALEKINKRAVKNGLPAIAYNISDSFPVKSARYDMNSPLWRSGDNCERPHVEITFDETPVTVAGYVPVATLDYSHSTPTVFEWPGKFIPESMRDVFGECSHCGKLRNRTRVFILENEETGEFANVGTGCVRDFLGYDPESILNMYKELLRAEEIGDSEYTETEWRRRPNVNLSHLLPMAVATIELRGWTSRTTAERSGYEVTATSDLVADWYWSFPNYELPKKLKDIDLSDEAKKRYSEVADRVVETCRNITAAGNTYEWNLLNIANDGFCTTREFNLAVSMVNYAMRLWEREDAPIVDKPTSEYVGEVGDKISLNATVNLVKPMDGPYGLSFLVKMVSDTGDALAWFSSREVNIDAGNTVAVKGTVKAHREWNGNKETTLTRCKLA